MAKPELRLNGQTSRGFMIFKKAGHTLHNIERAFALIAAVFIFALMMLGVAQVVGRKLFDTPIFGYIDMVELLMTTFAFLGVAYAERIGGHVRMELFIGRLTGRARWLVELLSIVIALFVIGVLIRYSFDHAMRAYDSGDTTIDAGLPWWPSKLLIPVAFALLWLRLLHTSIGLVRLALWPDAEPVGVPTSATVDTQAEREAREAQVLDGGT